MDDRLIKDISDFVFTEDKIEKADIIFIPGGSYPELAEEAARMWKEGLAPIIMPSGGVSIKTGKFNGAKSKRHLYDLDYKTEFDFLKDVLIKNGVDEEAILRENKASFTKQNATYSMEVVKNENLVIKKAIICCKAFHARRCLMSYQFVFPETKFYMRAVSILKNNNKISKNTWIESQEGIDLVLGEIERYSTQFRKEFYNKLTDKRDLC